MPPKKTKNDSSKRFKREYSSHKTEPQQQQHRQEEQHAQPTTAWGKTPGRQQAQPTTAWGKTPERQQAQPTTAWGETSGRQQAQPTTAWGETSGRQQAQPTTAWGETSGRQQAQPTTAWGKTPGRQQPQDSRQMPPPQPQQHPQGEGDSQRESIQSQGRKQGIPQKSGELVQAKSEEKPKGKPSEVPQGALEFAPRITASKKSGRAITVYANFFPLIILDPSIEVCHYDVKIEPDKPKFLLRDVWNKYMSLVNPGRLTAFDGKNAYSKGPLSNDTGVTTLTVINPEKTGKDPKDREKEFKVSIMLVKTINWSCFENYRERMLKDRSMKVLPEKEMAVLDIVMRNWACDNFIRSNKSFFHKASSSPMVGNLSEKLDLRFGYFQSAFLGYRPYLNFDISHKAFYKPIRVLDLIECFRNRYNKDLDEEGMNHFLRTVKVEYQLPDDPASKRVFRINKLVDNAKKQIFTKDDGSKMTVEQYFTKEKNCRLRCPELPLLWVGPTQKSIYVPMEFCKILPDQVYRGQMNPRETREMVRNSTSNARVRQDKIYDTFGKTDINKHPLMKEFGLKVGEDFEKVPARVLDAPRLKTSRTIPVKDGVWRISDFLNPVTLEKWCILILDQRVNRESVMDLQKLIKSKGNEFRMKISDPVRNPIEGDPSFNGLKRAFSQLKNMEMVFVIISDKKGLYSKVKAICETQEGILTQCIKSETLRQDGRKLSTTVDNILLKVNAKLGGINHSLDGNSVPVCLKGKVMIIGADVTHPSPGMKIPSAVGVTVSCDPEAFQYSTTTRVQPKGEMIKDLQEIVLIHLKQFFQLRKSYPEKIMFFRDGVSEGELQKVFNEELAALKNACKGLCQPKITLVIVQKRHHTRFFCTSEKDMQGKNYNVPVGTCVDSQIVHPRDMDFYLVSHASILGTARPTRYRIIHDENKLTDDELETVTFYLCHLFARCNRSVSYPAPTYNAHLAAARVRAHLEGLNLLGGQEIENIKKQLTDKISGIAPMFFV